MDRDPFKEYIMQSEPEKRYKCYAWHIAIGLQAVDGLKPSKYLMDTAVKNIEGVEMTMTELTKILTGLGVEIFGEAGDSFDPNLHNAVMHTEDESLGENVIAQVFQKGFKIGEKVVRFAMVQVAN